MKGRVDGKLSRLREAMLTNRGRRGSLRVVS